MYKPQFLISLALCCCISASASVVLMAQDSGIVPDVREGTLGGKVVDADGSPLVGVVVSIDGTDEATTTDLDGNFSISYGQEASATFSLLGFKTLQSGLKPGTASVVVMQEDLLALDEVVVVGYGTQKRATLTGSVDAVGGDEVNIGFVSNTTNSLTGKLSGVRVIQTSSEPGAFQSSINIRGLGAPLVVIDGMISSMDVFQRMSPNEIENVSVLKDASAAIYGMQASNGVLLVTTRKGMNSDGKPVIDYNGSVGFSHLINLNEPMNAYEYAILRNEVRKYALNPEAPMYSDEQLETIKNTPGLDVYDAVMKKVNPTHSHSVGVSGSIGQKFVVRYNVVGSYLKEYGLYRSGDMSYDRYNIRSNITADMGAGFSATVNLAYMKDQKDAPWSSEVYKYVWMVKPVDDYGNVLTSLYADDEQTKFLTLNQGTRNPLQDTMSDQVGYVKSQNKYFTGNLALNWDVPFVKGLSAKFQYSFEDKAMEQKIWVKKFSTFKPDASGNLIETVVEGRSNLKHEHFSWFNDNMQFSINYARQFGKHNIGILAVVEQQRYNTDPSYAALRYFQMDSLDELFAGSQSEEDQKVSATAPSKKVNRGYIARLNYDYAGKYLIEASFRYDGSSAFSSRYQWGFFPSVSAGWRLSEEGFIRNNPSLSFIDNLKIRASYGRLGDPGGAEFQWASGYNYPSGVYVFNDEAISGLVPKGYTNQALTWYTSDMYNLGFDFGFWNGMLGGSIEGYRRDRSGLLATRQGSLPATLGVSMPQENLNSDMTIGWELQLSHRHHFGDFRYGVTANFNMFRTMNKHVERAAPTNSFDNWRNNSNNRWSDINWGHIIGGQVTTVDGGRDLLNHQGTSQMALTGPGDYWHLDLNGDGYVDEWNDLAPVFTNSDPKVIFGFTINFEWKGIDFNAVFSGAGKYTVTYMEFLQNPLVFSGNGGALKLWTDRWHQDADGNWIAGKYPRYRNEWAYVPNVWTDSRQIKDATYLRLKNLEIGYSFPEKWMKKIRVQKLRVYASGYNLLTFSNVKELDPEMPSQYKYPMAMNFNFGINLTF